MKDLFNGFNPPKENWAVKQKEVYAKVCERRRELFSRKGKHGENLAKLIIETAFQEGVEISSTQVLHFMSGRTYNHNVAKFFLKVAEQKEQQYAECV